MAIFIKQNVIDSEKYLDTVFGKKIQDKNFKSKDLEVTKCAEDC